MSVEERLQALESNVTLVLTRLGDIAAHLGAAPAMSSLSPSSLSPASSSASVSASVSAPVSAPPSRRASSGLAPLPPTSQPPALKGTMFAERVERIERIDLSSNRLTHVPAFVNGLKSLTALYLAHNALESIEPRALALCDALRVVDLTSNRLTSLVGLHALRRLTTLVADKNAIDPYSVPSLPALEQLSLAHNALDVVPPVLFACDALRFVNLGHNKLTALPDKWTLLPLIERIDVRSNQLTALPSSMQQLTSLVSLNVKDNCLTNLPGMQNEKNRKSERHLQIWSFLCRSLARTASNCRRVVNVSSNAKGESARCARRIAASVATCHRRQSDARRR